MHPRPLIVWVRRTPLRRALTALAGLIAVLAVGLLDYVTGAGISFAGFYVLVIVAVTVVGGTAAGVMAGVASAGVWGVAEALTGRFNPGIVTQIGNGVVRCVVHVIVVFLVAALLRARDAARESEARSRAFLASAAHQLRTPEAALGTSVEALSADRGHVMIEVSDDGPGLPSGLESRAFDRFVTLDGRGGTGLGLAIARDLVRRQGGDLTYDHKAFLITLPRVEAESASMHRRPHMPDGGPPGSPVPGSAGRRT